MSNCSIHILLLNWFLEFEIRKDGSGEYVRGFHWSHLGSKSLLRVVRQRLLNDKHHMLSIISQMLVYKG
jgi:hypothetical protein